jgi:hypothetical protein
MFRHKDCKGQVLISLSEKMRIVSPGVRITNHGVYPGLTEVTLIGQKDGVSYICKNCYKEFLTEQDLEEIEVRCDADDEWHPTSEIYVTENYMFCSNCHEIVLGKNDSSDEHLLHLREVLSLPSSCGKIQLSKVMLKLLK